MEKIKYIHLHNHSEYSLLDGFCKIPDLVEAAKNNNMPAIGLTDHGNMFGAIKFYKECNKNSIIPVIGCEFYLAPVNLEIKENYNSYKYFHINLFAKNWTGYKNLIKLNTIAYKKGFYYKPRIDKNILNEYSEGLICTSSCILGDIPQALLSKNFDEAEKLAEHYQSIFNDDFYIELNNHSLKDEINVLPDLVDLANKKGIPLVAANDVHYINKEDAAEHNILLKINTHSSISDIETLSFENDEFYFKTENEMVEIFKDIPESLSNTKDIVLKCKLELYLNKKFYFPEFKTDAQDNFEYLKDLCYKNLEKKYPNNTKSALKRLEYELNIIKEKNFQNYFLIIADLIEFSKKNGILAGPGRGSAAGSIISYLLNITKIDPLKYHLLFERFLNKSRKKMPDIDLDFEHQSRNKIYEYLQNKYGNNNVAHIITFGTFQLKNAVRDAARVYEMNLDDVNKLVKIIDTESTGLNIEKLKLSNDFNILANKYPELYNIVNTANKILGIVKHVSIHPAGIIISPKKITEYLPLYYDNKTNGGISQYDMHSVEDIGLLKIDILAIKTLTVIHETLKLINYKIDLNDIPMNDKKIFKLFSEGKTQGIFQFESEGIKNLLIRLNPSNLNDIIDILALYRPGVLQSGMIDDYVAAKNGEKEIKYIHNNLEKVLKITYGLIIYQEQVMEIANIIAGYSLEEADLLRIAMSKKKTEIMAELREPFVKRAINKGYDEETARDIFFLIDKFAGYGFNKSHAAAYAYLSYYTAYLKVYFPIEYMISLLNYEDHLSDKIQYFIRDCRRMKIEFISSTLNNFSVKYKIIGNKIQIGLIAIKNFGAKLAFAVENDYNTNGNYESLIDFVSRNIDNGLNKLNFESLIKSGFFDSLYKSRQLLLENLVLIFDKAEYLNNSRKTKMLDLFDNNNTISYDDEFIKKLNEPQEIDYINNIVYEKEVLGYYYSVNPLQKYRFEYKYFSNFHYNLKDKYRLFTISLIIFINEKKSFNNNDFIEGELMIKDSSIKFFIWSNKYHTLKNKLTENTIYYIEGYYEKKYDAIVIEDVLNINDIYKTKIKELNIKLKTNNKTESKITELKQIIDSFNEGKIQINFIIESEESKKIKIAIEKMKNINRNDLIKISDIVDINNISIIIYV